MKGDGNCLYYAVQAGILFNTGWSREDIGKEPSGWEELKIKLQDNIDAEVLRLSEQGRSNLSNIGVNVRGIDALRDFNDIEKNWGFDYLKEQFVDTDLKPLLTQFLAGEITLFNLYKLKLEHHLKNNVFGDYLIVDSLAHLFKIPIRVFFNQDQTKALTVNERSTGQLVCILFDATKPHFDAYLPKYPPAAAPKRDVIDLTTFPETPARELAKTPAPELIKTPAHELLLCMWEYVPRPLPRV